MKKLVAVSLLASLAALPTFAEQPSFNFVEGGYTEYEDFEGFQLRGNFELNSNLFLNASYDNLSLKEEGVTFDTEWKALGLGYKIDTTDNTSVYATINYTEITSESDFPLRNPKAEYDGFQVAAGARMQISKQTQIYGEIAAYDIEKLGGRTELKLGLRQKISDNFGLYAEYKVDDFNSNGFGVGATINF